MVKSPGPELADNITCNKTKLQIFSKPMGYLNDMPSFKEPIYA